MRCHMFRFWGKPWRRRSGGPVPDVRVWIEIGGLVEEGREMVRGWKVGKRVVYVSAISGNRYELQRIEACL